MEETGVDIAKYVRTFMSGAADDSFNFMNLMVQAIAIIVVGLVLWRISLAFHRKKMAGRSDRKFGDRISNQIRSKGR
jgi:hypothetical protein